MASALGVQRAGSFFAHNVILHVRGSVWLPEAVRSIFLIECGGETLALGDIWDCSHVRGVC